MISLNACLAALILSLLSDDGLGVKKRVKVLGVTVGPFLGLLPTRLSKAGSTGDDIKFSTGVGFLLVRRLFRGRFSARRAMTAVMSLAVVT